MVFIDPEVPEDGVVSLLPALPRYRKILVPERKIGVLRARLRHHLGLQLHREGMPHIDHDPVDAELALVMKNLPYRLSIHGEQILKAIKH